MISDSPHHHAEKQLQLGIHRILSDPSAVFNTVSGKRLQILSPGRINVHEGPDFLEIAILLDGLLIVGDGEFHRRSSEWELHGHNTDERYHSVILHIVFDDDFPELHKLFETLKISPDDAEKALSDYNQDAIKEPDIGSTEDLQHYALLRLLRKTTEAQKLLNLLGLSRSFRQLVEDYIIKYNSRRKRPVYNINSLSGLVNNSNETPAYNFLYELSIGNDLYIPDRIQTLIKQKFGDEGAHLRREIILNCVLPLALCLANEESRIGLFLWYWSTPALHLYGILKRRFGQLPQNFLWQQQGMLEYMKEHGKKNNVVKEAIKNYGFAEVLSFYRLGRAPFKEILSEEYED